MLSYLRLPVPGTRFGVRAELRFPHVCKRDNSPHFRNSTLHNSLQLRVALGHLILLKTWTWPEQETSINLGEVYVTRGTIEVHHFFSEVPPFRSLRTRPS